MFEYCDQNGIVKVISSSKLNIDHLHQQQVKSIPKSQWFDLIGNKPNHPKKDIKDLRIALIANWGQQCGISTYTQYLADSIKPKIKELKIFSEHGGNESDVIYCWNRGDSMISTIKQIIKWQPDIVLIQHEFGLFPRATHFLKMLEMLDNVPYYVTMHSVYEHLDKSVCSSAIKNIIVHTEEAKQMLIRTGNSSNIFVIPHGCVPITQMNELWNIFQTPYCILQFGFGFKYKGVDVALEAIALLKQQEKYKDIFYCYLCSANENNKNIHDHYYEYLSNKTKELNIEENVTIIRKYQSNESLNYYLRTTKLAIFPYITDPDNTVYGASGAVRIAMSNQTPTVVSKSHLFDDLDGILPRPANAQELAKEIDEIFSNNNYRQGIIDRSGQFIRENSWDNVASQYLQVMTR